MSRPKAGKLIMSYSKVEKDVMFRWELPATRRDGHLLHHYLNCPRPPAIGDEWSKSLIEELESRGYDITTLKFSIEKKKDEQE